MAIHAAALVQQIHFIKQEDRSQATLRLERRRLEKTIEFIDASLSDRQYLLRSGFSACDISVGYSLHLASRFVALSTFIRVFDYHQRLSARSAFKSSLPENWSKPLGWLKDGWSLP
jgi:glutathione S-transferase